MEIEDIPWNGPALEGKEKKAKSAGSCSAWDLFFAGSASAFCVCRIEAFHWTQAGPSAAARVPAAMLALSVCDYTYSSLRRLCIFVFTMGLVAITWSFAEVPERGAICVGLGPGLQAILLVAAQMVRLRSVYSVPLEAISAGLACVFPSYTTVFVLRPLPPAEAVPR